METLCVNNVTECNSKVCKNEDAIGTDECKEQLKDVCVEWIYECVEEESYCLEYDNQPCTEEEEFCSEFLEICEKEEKFCLKGYYLKCVETK